VILEAMSRKAEVVAPSSAILSALLPATVSEDVIANLHELFADQWVPGTASRKRAGCGEFKLAC
jgi:hypothetical protein